MMISFKTSLLLGKVLLCSVVMFAMPVAADYDEYCYEMAYKLASDPSQMRLGDLDGLKSCIQELQRAGVVLHKQPAGAADKAQICRKPDLNTLCPVCPPAPTADAICPGWLAEKKAREVRERAEQRKQEANHKRLQPHIPGF